jgi:hypothetical protein
VSEENKNNKTKQIFKVLGILAISILVLVAVAFGLLVGMCGLMR